MCNFDSFLVNFLKQSEMTFSPYFTNKKQQLCLISSISVEWISTIFYSITCFSAFRSVFITISVYSVQFSEVQFYTFTIVKLFNYLVAIKVICFSVLKRQFYIQICIFNFISKFLLLE